MIRKMLVIATAITIPVSVVAVTGGVAGAGKATGVEADTLHCATEQAVANFSIPFTAKGVTSGQEMTTLSGSLSDCVVSGPTPVAGTVTGTISGTLISGKPGSAKHPAAVCSSLAGGVSTKEKGLLVVKWSGDPLVNGLTSVTKLKDIVGSEITVGGTLYGAFTVQGKALKTNLFQGTDKGKSSVASSMTVAPGATLLAQCGTSELGQIQLQAQPSGLEFS
jgi:hypothetical protein